MCLEMENLFFCQYTSVFMTLVSRKIIYTKFFKKWFHDFFLPGCPSPTDSDVNKNVSPSSISKTVFEDPLVAWAGILILFLMISDLECEKNQTDLILHNNYVFKNHDHLCIFLSSIYNYYYMYRQTEYQLEFFFQI